MSEPHSNKNRYEHQFYGAIGVPMAAIGLPFSVFMPHYYATDLNLGLEVTGLIFMIVRFWDMATDPVMGALVDRFPSRLGRVRHWLIASTPVLVVAGFALFMPMSSSPSPIYLFSWLLVLYLGFTMLQTPHQAWVPALTPDYDERSRYFMWREVFITIALIGLLMLPTALASAIDASRPQQIAAMGWVLIVSLPATVGLACWFVRDPPPDRDRPSQPQELNFRVLGELFKNSALVRVLSIEILIGLAIASTASTFLFAAKWGFGVEGEASAILLLFLLSGLVFMPVWFRVAERTEKHTTLQILCIYAAIAHLSYLPFYWLGGGTPILLAGAILSGVPFGAPLALLRSMLADIVEQETKRTKSDRSGLTFSLLTSAFKTGQSFAVGIPFILLGWLAGFDPSGDNSPEAIRNLMIVFAGIPAISYGLAAVFAHNYPLTRTVQANLR